MLTPEELEYVPQGISKLFRDLQLNIMSDIVERIAYNKEITRTADLEISRLYELGTSKEVIKRHIKRTLGLTSSEIDRIYKTILAEDYARYEPIYKQLGESFVPYRKNKPLQQLINGIKEQTKAEFKNITQSLGFAVKNAKGAVTFKPIAKFYQETLDNASMQIMSGAYDYNSVIKRAVKQMTDSGLRTVDYASGISNRVEVAARRAVMTGFNQTVGRITEENAEKLGTEYFEVTYHQGARPTHQPWQGRVYSKSELVSVCGYGNIAGLKGANCRHDFHPFFPGVSKRLYTDEELDRMNAEENTPKEYKGKQYTTYEATQRQRRIETALRAKREEIHLLEQGGADADDILAKKAKYHGLSSEYAEFSKAMGLPQERQRVNISPFKGVDESIGKPLTKSAKALEKSGESGIIQIKGKNLFDADIKEFEEWQKDYYKVNEGVSFLRADNPNIYEYTGGTYGGINAVLRGGDSLAKAKRCYGDGFDEAKYKKIANGISNELSKFKLNEPLELRRCVGSVDFITGASSSVEDMKKAIGKVYTEKGFTSTSICGEAYTIFGGNSPTKTTLEIIAPTHTKGAYIYKISDSPAEFEFLIDKNTSFKILDAGEREITVKDYRGRLINKTERYIRMQVI